MSTYAWLHTTGISVQRDGGVRFNTPPNTSQVILGMGFYGSNDPTNSVKALKEDRVLRIRLQSHQVHLTVLQYHIGNIIGNYTK